MLFDFMLIYSFKSLGIFDGQSKFLSKLVIRSVAREVQPVETNKPNRVVRNGVYPMPNIYIIITQHQSSIDEILEGDYLNKSSTPELGFDN